MNHKISNKAGGCDNCGEAKPVKVVGCGQSSLSRHGQFERVWLCKVCRNNLKNKI